MPEKNIQNEIRLAVSKATGGRGFALRNHTGTFQTMAGAWVEAGLGTGTADLIGCVEYTIQPEDVGRTVGIFLAIEVKTPLGKLKDEQRNFLSRVAELGGLVAVARTVEEALKFLSQKWEFTKSQNFRKARDRHP